jgi:hypothetical protein
MTWIRGKAISFVNRIYYPHKVHDTVLLLLPLSQIPRIPLEKYLLPYLDHLSSEDILYNVRLSPKSQDRFCFWLSGIDRTERPKSVSGRVLERLPFSLFDNQKATGKAISDSFRRQRDWQSRR